MHAENNLQETGIINTCIIYLYKPKMNDIFLNE